MFSYIYADGRGNINYAIGANTKKGIDALALDNIRNMIRNEIGYSAPGTGAGPKEQQEVLDACGKEDVVKAIEAWDRYATTVLKHTISCHKIEPFNIVE